LKKKLPKDLALQTCALVVGGLTWVACLLPVVGWGQGKGVAATATFTAKPLKLHDFEQTCKLFLT
jgi:hypothetical protein